MAAPLTILITTLNRRHLLEMTLWYLYETSTDEERSIWIWDNASEDDTAAFLGTLVDWPGVRVFRSPVGAGILGPKMQMVRAISTPYVFTMDDDMWQLHPGWASAVVRVLEAEPSIHQLAFGGVGDGTCNFGISHEKLDRPFFRVPPIYPYPTKAPVDDIACPDGALSLGVNGEMIMVPIAGPHLPYPYTGGCSGWRTSDVLSILPFVTEKRPVVDLTEAWGHPLADRGLSTRAATMLGYGFFHPSPGPLWHLGRGELYWEERCRMARDVYNRSDAEQRSWLVRARTASGWGQPLEDPDVVLG